MKVVIIEDEKLSADYLQTILSKIDGNIEVVKVIESVKDAILAFENGLEADLAFVDIHLSDGNSFDIFSKVDVSIPIIFTTAYDEYALKAFKLNSIDYLLKPIGRKELEEAIQKFKRNSFTGFKIHKGDLVEPEFKNRFTVKSGESIFIIPIDQIKFFVSESSYTFLYTTAGKKYIIDYKMDELEQLLNPKLFFRISRKTIIQIHSIDKISSYFNSRLLVSIDSLEKDAGIVSRERVSSFKKWIE